MAGVIALTEEPGVPTARRSAGKFYVISCGGRTGPGGMPRMVDYYMTEWEAQGRAPQLMLIDSTGPSYDWRRQPLSAIWRQPIYCFRALAQVVGAGLLGRVAGLHIHMAERGSVFRKAISWAAAQTSGCNTYACCNLSGILRWVVAYRPKMGEARSQTS